MKQAASIVKVGVVFSLYLGCASAMCSILSIYTLSLICYLLQNIVKAKHCKYKEKYDDVLIDSFWEGFLNPTPAPVGTGEQREKAV